LERLIEFVDALVLLAEALCKVLRASTPRSRVMEILWTGDSGEEVEGASLPSRANVLKPFASLNVVKLVERGVLGSRSFADCLCIL
jgi:hypothetical protein